MTSMLWRPVAVASGVAAFLVGLVAVMVYVSPLQPFVSVFLVALVIAVVSLVLAIGRLERDRRGHRVADIEVILLFNGPSSVLIASLLATFALSKLVVLVWWGQPPLWLPALIAGLVVVTLVAALLHQWRTRYYGEAMPGQRAPKLGS